MRAFGITEPEVSVMVPVIVSSAACAIQMVARPNTTVLITGESGTGKDLVAQEIHLLNPRKKVPLVIVELYSHERRATWWSRRQPTSWLASRGPFYQAARTITQR
jgi:ABC-type dipeptide/oligopeptide/nickel transport system ATPase component